MAAKFSRFSESRDTSGSTTTYDGGVEAIEYEESAGLHIPITKTNIGFKLIEKMGWKEGGGLGKKGQGRVDPIPMELKDNNKGLGRFQQELELAAEATEKRKQLEIEKEITPDLVHKYKTQVAKEHAISESTQELRKTYFCDLCDKQYTKYSEYDNHLNSYDHHHRQRLKDLKDYEKGRLFKPHVSAEERKQKMVSAKKIAVERAHMRAEKKKEGGATAGFRPITAHRKAPGTPLNTTVSSDSRPRKRSQDMSESERKIAEKKAKLEKKVKFESAGHLKTINSEAVLSSYQSTLFASTPEVSVEDKATPKRDTAHTQYGGRFVAASTGPTEEEIKEEKEREKRLATLPQATGRMAEKLAAFEDSDDEDDFAAKCNKKARSYAPKTDTKASKPPAKQMMLKLTDRYESYYH